MEFYKMHGAGNDFIIINNMKLNIPVEKFPAIAKKVCRRKLSVGADGFMVMDYPEGSGDFKMLFYNSDGTVGEMCGNGARCISRFAYMNDIAKKNMIIETPAGLVESEILDERNVRVLLNKPEIIKLDNDIDIDGINYECSYIELGKPGLPHAAVKYNLQNYDDDKLRILGKNIRHYGGFLKGANVNFYEIISGNTAIVKTFERGVEDFTLACGTGSASVAVILILKGYIKGNNVKIITEGGELFIEVENDKNIVNKLYLIGDTNVVAIGKITDEDLNIG